MKISPMDIQRQTFTRRFRGFDPRRGAGLSRPRGRGDRGLQNDRDNLARRVQELDAALHEHRERELILKNTLLTAQRVSEEIREAARRQGESVTKEAELQADRLLELAQSRANDVQRSILELRSHRTALRMDIRAVVKRLTTLLDLQEEAEEQDNIAFLKRRKGPDVREGPPRAEMAIDIREDADGVTLPVRVQPRASRDGLGGEREGALVVRLTAPPVEGRGQRGPPAASRACLWCPAHERAHRGGGHRAQQTGASAGPRVRGARRCEAPAKVRRAMTAMQSEAERARPTSSSAALACSRRSPDPLLARAPPCGTSVSSRTRRWPPAPAASCGRGPSATSIGPWLSRARPVLDAGALS